MVQDWIPLAPQRQTAAASPEVSSGEHQPKVQIEAAPGHEAEEDLSQLSEHQLRRLGDEAFRVRDYRKAADAFSLLAVRNGNSAEYNDVAKSKHGSSLWRIAEQPPIDGSEKEKLIRRAVDLLEDASAHRDPRYQARALYEKSKALWHLWRLKGDTAVLKSAHLAAGAAARLQNEPSIISWYEKVTDDLERAN